MQPVQLDMTISMGDDFVVENLGESAELEIIQSGDERIISVTRSKHDGIDIRIPDDQCPEIAKQLDN